jgi:hypothetical protein
MVVSVEGFIMDWVRSPSEGTLSRLNVDPYSRQHQQNPPLACLTIDFVDYFVQYLIQVIDGYLQLIQMIDDCLWSSYWWNYFDCWIVEDIVLPNVQFDYR